VTREREQIAVSEAEREAVGCAQGARGVGAGGTDAEFVEIEEAGSSRLRCRRAWCAVDSVAETDGVGEAESRVDVPVACWRLGSPILSADHPLIAAVSVKFQEILYRSLSADPLQV
jgi:hypothetical protein